MAKASAIGTLIPYLTSHRLDHSFGQNSRCHFYIQKLLIWSSRMKGNHRNQEILAGIFGRTNLLLWALEGRRTLDIHSVHRKSSFSGWLVFEELRWELHMLCNWYQLLTFDDPITCNQLHSCKLSLTYNDQTYPLSDHSTRIQMQIPQWWNKTLRPFQPTTWLQAYAATHRGEALVEVSLPRKIQLFSWFSAMNSIIT